MPAHHRTRSTDERVRRHRADRARPSWMFGSLAAASLLGIIGLGFAYPPVMQTMAASEHDEKRPTPEKTTTGVMGLPAAENLPTPGVSPTPSLTPAISPTPVLTSASVKPEVPRPTRAPAPPPVPERADSRVLAVMDLVNQERRAVGCSALASSPALTRAAQLHAEDMVRRDYFSHVSPDGTEVMERARSAGFTGGAVAENIAEGQDSPRAVMRAWMRSSGHRANILNCSYRYIGVGVAGSGSDPTWVQNFGR